MEALTQPTVFFAMVLALALLTERFIEVVKVFFDWLDYQCGFDTFWSRKAQDLQGKLRDRLGFVGRISPDLQNKIIGCYRDRTLNDTGNYQGRTIVISGDLIRVVFTRAVAKVLGLLFGVVLAWLFQIDLFAYVNANAEIAQASSRHFNLQIFISGLGIGLGAGPVHKIITTIERARERRKARQAAKEG